ncbi:TolC family protein [Rhodopirellula sallentina]|nr:TolC family protein [Rhodopirellula sallentina]
MLRGGFRRRGLTVFTLLTVVAAGYWTAPGAGAADPDATPSTSFWTGSLEDAWSTVSNPPSVAAMTPTGQPDPSFGEFWAAVSRQNPASTVTVEPILTPEPDASVDRADVSPDIGEEPWWRKPVNGYLLNSPNYLQFDVATVLTDTLQSSPRISAISNRTSIAYEKIIQQDAAFDPSVLLETGIDRVNDPVGSTLTTGGPPRLIQDSWNASAGVRKLTRQGTVIDLSQEAGTLTSNSIFFDPAHQGNSRLNLSITQPLMATSGRVYNTRLVTAASIDSRIAWQQLRLDLESHLVETLTAFWRLHERRAHYVQQLSLIERGERIGAIVAARGDFDSGPLQEIKIRRRLASDNDRKIELRAEVQRLQVRLKTLVGSPMLTSLDDSIELIPMAQPDFPEEPMSVRDCIVRGLEHRGDIQAATEQLASAGLEVNVTRNELMPRLDAVFEAYLSGLASNNNIGQSWINQYSDGGPGITAALTYNLPWGRRAAKSRLREARLRYKQRGDELRNALLAARREIETSVIRVRAGADLRRSKAATLAAAVREEDIATRRWEMLAGDGGPTALILEDLLETQKRRTEAEQAYVSAQVNYILELITLQQAMGTFLIREGIEPTRPSCSTSVEILQTSPINERLLPLERWTQPMPVDGVSGSDVFDSGNLEFDAGRSLIAEPQMIELDASKTQMEEPHSEFPEKMPVPYLRRVRAVLGDDVSCRGRCGESVRDDSLEL